MEYRACSTSKAAKLEFGENSSPSTHPLCEQQPSTTSRARASSHHLNTEHYQRSPVDCASKALLCTYWVRRGRQGDFRNKLYYMSIPSVSKMKNRSVDNNWVTVIQVFRQRIWIRQRHSRLNFIDVFLLVFQPRATELASGQVGPVRIHSR